MSSPRTKVGYSCWGFLGNGIINTPDGGRSHRVTLLNSLITDQNCSLLMLQKNRDLLEASDPIGVDYLEFTDDLPDVDFVFLEYRWPIPGRNSGVEKTDPNYTPDLDRQTQIINHYAKKGTPILIWDKDQQLNTLPVELKDALVAIFEPSLAPKEDRISLLFPADTTKLERAREGLSEYKKVSRTTDLIYIGNQYDRDESFQKYYLDESLSDLTVDIYGKWNIATTPGVAVNFHGRVGYENVGNVYSRSACHILIAPDRYYKNGQYTQRIFESLWEHCIPLVPIEYQLKEYLFPEELWVRSGTDVRHAIESINNMGDGEIQKLIQKLIHNVEHLYSPTRQSSIIMQTYRRLVG